ncbi:unnamed protein product, partial [Nesidiocoris tenuis]
MSTGAFGKINLTEVVPGVPCHPDGECHCSNVHRYSLPHRYEGAGSKAKQCCQ